MDIFDGGGVTRAVSALAGFVQGFPPDAVVRNIAFATPVENLSHLKEFADLLCRELEKLSLASLACARRVQQILATAVKAPPSPNRSGEWVTFTVMRSAELRSACEDLARRVPDELRACVLLGMAADKAEYYNQSEPPFGRVVQDRFPSLIDEIAEASKCYALNRATASAFHSIRCLEAGIGALARCLNIPDPTKAAERNWGAVLKKVKDGIDARWPTSSDQMAGDGEFFANAYAALAAMQNPWRNATMHLDQTYTEEQAKHIFDVVKGFMATLASRMDEKGQPLA